jgi:hypothetical protein
VSTGLPVIATVMEVIYFGRYALMPTRTVLSTVSETESALRCLLEFSRIIEIVAFEAENGLVEPVQESKSGMKIDGRMRSQESFLHILHLSLKELTKWFLFQGKLVLKEYNMGIERMV